MFDLEHQIRRWRESLADHGVTQRAIVEELEAHLRESFEDKVNSGLDPAKAFHASADQLGDPAKVGREFAKLYPPQSRQLGRRFWQTVKVFPYELSLVSRRLLRRRSQTALMFVTFGVSICLSLLSWSLFHAIFLRNPSFDPEGSLCIVEQQPKTEFWINSTRQEVDDFVEQQTVFSTLSAVVLYNSSFLTHEGMTERMMSANLSTDSLRMLGARPLLGRLFTAREDRPGCAPVILLSEATWRERFGADPHVVGRLIKLDGVGATIVGVMPSEFRFPNNQQIWLPLGFLNSLNSDPTRTFDAIGRLKPGVSLELATTELTQIQARRPQTGGVSTHPVIHPFRNYFLERSARTSTAVLFALSILFVLVSCANAANLAMIDFFGRRVELATSAALGIPRLATLRHVILQIFVVALCASFLALGLLAWAAPHLHAALTQMNAPYWLEFSLGAHHFAMAFGLAAFSTGVALIVPAGYLFVVNPDEVIRSGAGGNRGSANSAWRRLLLVIQIGLLTLLAVCAAVLVRSNLHLSENALGFNPESVFLGKVGLREVDFPTVESRQLVFRKIADEVSQISGVTFATITNFSPGYPLAAGTAYAADTAALADGKFPALAVRFAATEGFLQTTEIPLVAGEDFRRSEISGGPIYAIINQSMAERLWPNQDPLGRPLYTRNGLDPNAPLSTLVVRGVTRDFRACGPMREQNDAIYTSLTQLKGFFGFLLVRGAGGVPSPQAVQAAVRRADLRVALYFPDSMRHQIDLTMSPIRLTSRLTLLFAAAAGLLCAVGLYSLTVSQVLQRSREFGIRMALGLEPQRLWLQFAREYLLTAAVGIGLGVAVSFPALTLLKSLMYGLNPYNPVTIGMVGLGILLIAAAACIPSLFRLLRIHPADCLRST